MYSLFTAVDIYRPPAGTRLSKNPVYMSDRPSLALIIIFTSRSYRPIDRYRSRATLTWPWTTVESYHGYHYIYAYGYIITTFIACFVLAKLVGEWQPFNFYLVSFLPSESGSSGPDVATTSHAPRVGCPAGVCRRTRPWACSPSRTWTRTRAPWTWTSP